MVNIGTIRKSRLASELGITRARVSQLIQGGMPVCGDGLLDLPEVLRWIVSNGSSQVASRASKLLAGSASAPGVAPTPEIRESDLSIRIILDRLFANVAVLPTLAEALGAPRCAAESAGDVITSWLWWAIGERILTRIYGDDGPPPPRYEMPPTEEGDLLVDRAQKFFDSLDAGRGTGVR